MLLSSNLMRAGTPTRPFSSNRHYDWGAAPDEVEGERRLNGRAAPFARR